MAAKELICRFDLRFGEIRIAPRLELDFGEAKTFVLTGPSAAGKTTLLRCIAGLEQPGEASIYLGDRCWHDSSRGRFVSPQERRVGFLHQENALFPHLTVRDNVAFAAGGSPDRVAELMERCRVDELAERYPGGLSGGQKQRVALARALAGEPRLLLLDEPFSALDRPAAVSLLGELEKVAGDIPTLVVTHDWTETLGLADHLVLMDSGIILQSGPVDEVLQRPTSPEAARIVGAGAVLKARVEERIDGLLVLSVNGIPVQTLDPGDGSSEYYLSLRPSDVLIQARPATLSSARNQWPATVTEIRSEGDTFRVVLNAGFTVSALLTRPAVEELALREGEPVTVAVKASAIHLMPVGS